ncbi:MAG TPA: DNA primase [Acidimicrobiales bacterium]|nr:DNA primase [Acidimicrobiales bacterium]
MGIHDEDVAAVRAASDIVQIVSEYTPLRRVGRQWTGLCPFHSEKTPSFSVNANENVFYCFGCQAKGDVIDFVMEKEQVDFPAAVERLAARTNITLRYTDRDEGEGRKRRARLVDVVTRAAAWYHERLVSGPDAGAARRYLRERGFDGEVVRDFQIGWAPDAWDALTRALRLDRETAEATGLARLNSRGRLNDHFRARIMFPIHDDRGDPISFGGRILPGGEGPGNQGKYKNTTETPLYNKSKVLYGLDRAKTSIVTAGTAVICEGYTDVIGFHRSGVPLAVATCGTALTDDHVRLLTRFSAQRLVLAFDADSAGQAAADRFYRWEREHDLEVAVADLPPGQDPADVAATDPARLAAAVERATPFLRFRLDRAFAAADLATNEGRARAAERALEIVAEHPTELVRDQYLMDVASRCRVEPDRLRVLLEEVRRRPARGGAAAGGRGRGRGHGAGGSGRRDGDRGPAARSAGRRDDLPPHPADAEPPWLAAAGAGRAVDNRPDDLAVGDAPGAVTASGGLGARGGRDGRAGAQAGIASRRAGPALEVLRHAVHAPEEVGQWLDAALFDDPVHRAAFQALVDADTHADALAAAEPEVADLLARLLVAEPTSEPFDAVRLLCMDVARRQIAAVRLAAGDADVTRALTDLVELTRISDGLRNPRTAADSADRLLAWLAERVGDGG